MSDPELNLSQAFHQVVQSCADRPALAGDFCSLSYRELDSVSSHLACEILSTGGNVGDRVAILMDHSSLLIAAVLGVVKAGRIVVVLNSCDPPVRHEAILQDAEASLIVTSPRFAELAEGLSPKTHRLLFSLTTYTGKPPIVPPLKIHGDDVASLIYTSGSTGHPKGVMKTHRHIRDNAERLRFCLEVTDRDRIACLASLSGGHGEATMWLSLLTGSTLCPFAVMVRGVTGLASWLRDNGVTVYSSSTSLFRSLLKSLPADHRMDHVRAVRLASDAASATDLEGFRQHFHGDCLLIHTLASSETGVISFWKYEGQASEYELLPVGRACPGIDISLIDHDGNEVSPGDVGELVVRGRTLAAGYWRLPDLTAERFRDREEPGGNHSFHSGDRAKRLPDGSLLFAGRTDNRLKIRGYRIEPSDIELALTALREVREAVVCDVPGPAGNPLLAAFVTGNPGSDCRSKNLRRQLQTSLPDYMIPATLTVLDEFPLTPNGKVDRDALRRIQFANPQKRLSDPPQTNTESRLAEIWAKAFGFEEIGCSDHFFERGGDSLLAAVIAAQIHAEWAVEISMRTFTEAPTVRQMAKLVGRAATKEPLNTDTSNRQYTKNTSIPLTFMQQAIFNASQSPEGMEGWLVSRKFQITGELNLKVLSACMTEMQSRHEILRTTYHIIAGELAARVHEAADLPLETLDFSPHPDPEERADRFFREQTRNTRFDLAHLPLYRFWLIRLSGDTYRLMYNNHHIISDGWSWKIYWDELIQLYDAAVCGGQRELPPAPQFADYAIDQHERIQRESQRYRSSIEWWKTHFRGGPSIMTLPFERAAPCANASPSDGVVYWEIPPQVAERLEGLAGRCNATYLGIRLAVFLAALAEASGSVDLIIGSYASARTRVNWQQMFGLFANTVVLRMQWEPRQTFVQWLQNVSSTLLDVQANSEIPYEWLNEQLRADMVEPPSISLIFSVTNQNVTREFHGFRLTHSQRLYETMPWGFTVKLDPYNERNCKCTFDARKYDPRRVRQFVTRYQQLLDRLSREPELRMKYIMKSVLHSEKGGSPADTL